MLDNNAYFYSENYSRDCRNQTSPADLTTSSVYLARVVLCFVYWYAVSIREYFGSNGHLFFLLCAPPTASAMPATFVLLRISSFLVWTRREIPSVAFSIARCVTLSFLCDYSSAYKNNFNLYGLHLHYFPISKSNNKKHPLSNRLIPEICIQALIFCRCYCIYSRKRSSPFYK